MTRPTNKELAYLGLSALQIRLTRNFPDDLVREIYEEQLRRLMENDENDVDI